MLHAILISVSSRLRSKSDPGQRRLEVVYSIDQRRGLPDLLFCAAFSEKLSRVLGRERLKSRLWRVSSSEE